MGKQQRDAGLRFERKIVNLVKDAGLDAKRVPLSGAAEGFKGDVIITTVHEELNAECKMRSGGFKFIYENLEGHDVLIVQQKFNKPLAIVDFDKFLQLLGGYDARDRTGQD